MSNFKSLEASYKEYYDNFMKKKHDREEKEKKINETLSARLGTNVTGISILSNYDEMGDPKTFEDYVDWLSKADEREQHAKELEEQRKKEYEERLKEAQDKSNTFKEYLNTLPKSYTPNEWRKVSKHLNLKPQRIPRLTKTLEVVKKDNGLEIKYIK